MKFINYRDYPHTYDLCILFIRNSLHSIFHSVASTTRPRCPAKQRKCYFSVNANMPNAIIPATINGGLAIMSLGEEKKVNKIIE